VDIYTLSRRRKTMNKEYLQAKADLCRDLAIQQMVDGNSGEAGKNLIRMVNALNEISLINYKEEKNEANKLL
jgi:hypothetical protein